MHEFGVLIASHGDVRVGGVVLSVWWWRLGLLLCESVVCGWCGGVAWSLVCGVVDGRACLLRCIGGGRSVGLGSR